MTAQSIYDRRPMYSLLLYLKITDALTGRMNLRSSYLSPDGVVILKRLLKVNDPLIEQAVAKIVKRAIPTGQPASMTGMMDARKWRAANMKVISTIFLRTRPELREEWLQTSLTGDDTNMQHEQSTEDESVVRDQERIVEQY